MILQLFYFILSFFFRPLKTFWTQQLNCNKNIYFSWFAAQTNKKITIESKFFESHSERLVCNFKKYVSDAVSLLSNNKSTGVKHFIFFAWTTTTTITASEAVNDGPMWIRYYLCYAWCDSFVEKLVDGPLNMQQ